jgi:hypothetical protein
LEELFTRNWAHGSESAFSWREPYEANADEVCAGAVRIWIVAAVVAAQQQSRDVLGKNDYAVLMDAAPGVPSTPAEAGRRAYGTDVKMQDSTVLDDFYAPFNRRVAAARDVIKDAVANRRQHQEALGQRSIAQANASPIVHRMGGTDKISEMSEEEAKQAAAKAAGSYQQSLQGGPGTPSGGGMQAMMQRMMSDPAYQARFEKMTKKEQEAELQKYMGNAQAPPPPVGESVAERRAAQNVNETSAVVAQQNELGAIMQRLLARDAEFDEKDRAILAAPGGYDEINNDIQARIAKLPVIAKGEAGDMVDPVKLQVLERERATRDRTRAASELQQRAALYTRRKTHYKEVAASYNAWLKRSLRPANSQTAQLLDDGTVEMAVQCEEDLLGQSEKLAQYTQEATTHAAQYESAYHKKMSGPTVK